MIATFISFDIVGTLYVDIRARHHQQFFSLERQQTDGFKKIEICMHPLYLPCKNEEDYHVAISKASTVLLPYLHFFPLLPPSPLPPSLPYLIKGRGEGGAIK